MIVSFAHHFVFVAIPKTATHAVRTALRPHLGPRDWEQCVLFDQRFFPVGALARIGHGHVACRELRPFLVPGLFETFFKFCTVRNPYERFVSCCRFVNRDNERMRQAPLETMKRTIGDAETCRHVLFRPQSEFVTDEDGRLLVDYVCRFEGLQAHFDRVSERLGLPQSPLPQVNVTRVTRVTSVTTNAPGQCCLDRELHETLRDVYRRDFALFGYDC
jgi:sulfotransferase famil protein